MVYLLHFSDPIAPGRHTAPHLCPIPISRKRDAEDDSEVTT